MATHPGALFDYEDEMPGARPITEAVPWFVALPTTAGTGSEVGRSAVIADDATHIKKIIFSPHLLARVVFADPELTVGLPAAVTGATGMDAITHNIEAYLAKGYNPICDGIALEGLRLGAAHLARAVAAPADLDARGAMLMSSMMGAIAFQKGLGLVHSTAHALGTVADLHHGLANAVMIDHALRFNVEAVPERFEVLGEVVGIGDPTADVFLRWLDEPQGRDRCPRVARRDRRRPDDAIAAGRVGLRGLVPSEQPASGHRGRLRSHLRGGVLVTDGGATDRPVRIGLSACFFHADPTRPIFKGKTLLYFEESMARYLGSTGSLVYLLPRAGCGAPSLDALVDDLDGLVLEGGSDVCPRTYGEEPLRPEWEGDEPRDRYEIDLLRAFHAAGKPVLGICRGVQLLNVAFGGTLHQDITMQVPGSLVHRDWDRYDTNTHDIDLVEGGGLASLYPGVRAAVVNSVHHQAVKDVGDGLVIEAVSTDDGVIEALRLDGDRYVAGVQWHPEFTPDGDTTQLPSAPLLAEFEGRAREVRSWRS